VGVVADPSPRVAIVTGAAGGIGRAIVVDLVANGYAVVGIGRTAPGSPVAGASFEVADVSVAAEVERAIANTLDRFGRIDVLVTSAAILKTGPIHTMDESLWDEVMDINLKGVFLCCRAVLPAMIAAGRGSIVNLSSVHAVATIAGTAAYAATKGAIVSLSRQLAVEYADSGIRSNSIVVGSVDTAMSTAHGEAIARDGVVVGAVTGRLGRMGQPEEIATAVRFLAGDDSSFLTGAALTVDGGLLSRLM
jgi:NAD(P)-dependent dehydrogenase (short-subunit alcohol dehydrogenase family)